MALNSAPLQSNYELDRLSLCDVERLSFEEKFDHNATCMRTSSSSPLPTAPRCKQVRFTDYHQVFDASHIVSPKKTYSNVSEHKPCKIKDTQSLDDHLAAGRKNKTLEDHTTLVTQTNASKPHSAVGNAAQTTPDLPPELGALMKRMDEWKERQRQAYYSSNTRQAAEGRELDNHPNTIDASNPKSWTTTSWMSGQPRGVSQLKK